MYRVETKTLRDLLRMWLEDNPERRATAQSPERGDVYTSITDEYGCVWFGQEDGVPAHLNDRVVEHYLNERTSHSDMLVSCCRNGDAVLLVWRVAD